MMVSEPYIYEVKRHSNEHHPLFYFMSFTNPCSFLSLTVIVIVLIVYINKTTSSPIPSTLEPDHQPTLKTSSL
jgi:hypothetical protein